MVQRSLRGRQTAWLGVAFVLTVAVTSCGGGSGAPATASPTGTGRLTPSATATSFETSTTTGDPFVAEAVECRETYSTPEEAIAGCTEIDRARFTPCDGSFDAGEFCRWRDGADTPRAYLHSGSAPGRTYEWFILERRRDGWTVTGRALCDSWEQMRIDDGLAERGLDISAVRADDCRFPPEPLPRPTLRVWPSELVRIEGDLTILFRPLFYPGRGIHFRALVQSESDPFLSSTPPSPGDVALVSEDGDRFAVSEMGGVFAGPTGDPPNFTGSGVDGWLVFPIDDLGVYTLKYPGQPDLVVDLSPRPSTPD